jgi:hypothetical protein
MLVFFVRVRIRPSARNSAKGMIQHMMLPLALGSVLDAQWETGCFITAPRINLRNYGKIRKTTAKWGNKALLACM